MVNLFPHNDSKQDDVGHNTCSGTTISNNSGNLPPGSLVLHGMLIHWHDTQGLWAMLDISSSIAIPTGWA